MSENDRAFYAGFASGFARVIASLIRAYDQPTIAVDIMRSSGVKLEDLQEAEVDASDLQTIREAWEGARKPEEPFGPDWVHRKAEENERGFGRKS